MIILKFYPNKTRLPFKANDVKLVSSGQVATSLMVHHPVINSCVSVGCFFPKCITFKLCDYLVMWLLDWAACRIHQHLAGGRCYRLSLVV